MLKLKLSACAIMKDEEKNIACWLRNMQQLADEIIVVDTGSVDRTAELAREGGAEVYPFSWCDDFAAAKNFALEQATGDWILFLDADEYFSAEALPRVRAIIENFHANKRIAGLVSPWICINPENHNALILSGHQVRIFRNERALRYVGHIHEALSYAFGLREYRLTDLKIYHTGYNASNEKEKSQRNLRILQQDAERNGGERPEQYGYFADAYMGLGDNEKACRYAILAVENEGAGGLLGTSRKAYSRMLRLMEITKRVPEEQKRAIAAGIERHPQWGELYWYEGKYFSARGDYGSAERSFEHAAELAEQPDTEDKSKILDSELGMLRLHIYYALGVVYAMHGYQEKAMVCWQKTLREYPYHELAFRQLYRCLQEKNPVDIIACLDQFYQRGQDRAYLQRMLQEFPLNEVYLYYVEPSADSYEACMAAGAYQAAAEQISRRMETVFQSAAGRIAREDGRINRKVWKLLMPDRWQREAGR